MLAEQCCSACVLWQSASRRPAGPYWCSIAYRAEAGPSPWSPVTHTSPSSQGKPYGSDGHVPALGEHSRDVLDSLIDVQPGFLDHTIVTHVLRQTSPPRPGNSARIAHTALTPSHRVRRGRAGIDSSGGHGLTGSARRARTSRPESTGVCSLWPWSHRSRH
jgi:hypothetical protein